MKKILLVLSLLISINLTAKCQVPTTNTDTIIVYSTKSDSEAAFPGGLTAWGDYLRQNLNANVPVFNKAPEGTYVVTVNFLIRVDGSISDVVAETNFGYGMEQEAIRVIKNSPNWIPGSQNGRSVNAYRKQPITFSVRRQ